METFAFGNRGNKESTHDSVIHFTVENSQRVLVERETNQKIWAAIGITTEKKAKQIKNYCEAVELYDNLTSREETFEWQ